MCASPAVTAGNWPTQRSFSSPQPSTTVDFRKNVLTNILSVKYDIDMKKNPHAAALGKLGGKARARKTTLEERKAWARLGGLARAKRHSKQQLTEWAKMGGRPPKKA